MKSFNEQLAEFVRAGNTVIGVPVSISGHASLSWSGSNSAIRFGEGVKINALALEIEDRSTLDVGNGTFLDGSIRIGQDSTLTVGCDTTIDRGRISTSEAASIEIGNACLLNAVTINTSDMHSILDGISGKRLNPAMNVAIRDEVWLSEDVVVSKGVEIGCGAIVGAGSLVAQSLPAHTLSKGNPAQVVRWGVSWRRELVPSTPLPTKPLEAASMIPPKEVMQQMLKRNEFDAINRILSSISAAGTEWGAMPNYALYYGAQAKISEGDLAEAVRLLDVITQRSPQHVDAAKLKSQLVAANSMPSRAG